MELLDRIFDPKVRQPLLGTVMERPHPKVEPLRRRPEVKIIRVTAENREALAERIVEMLGGEQLNR